MNGIRARRFRTAIGRVARAIWVHRGRLLLVVDEAGWVIDDIGQALSRHLPSRLRARVVGAGWTDARNCTIHFIDRPWAWRDGVLDHVHPSNRLLGLWWHGRLDSPDVQTQAGLHRLRRIHNRFARIQVTCTIGRDTLLALGVPPEKIVQLPEGINLAQFQRRDTGARAQMRRRLGIADPAIAIGCFQKDGEGWGNGDTPKLVKGPDVFVDSLIALHRNVPIHAVIPGPARGYISRRLSKAGIPFSAPGFVRRAEIPSLYHALDIYVSPSRDEGGPAGVLEAMAAGVPVVSTISGMAADLITSGENGLLVPVDAPAALAAAVARLADSAEMRKAFACRATSTIAAYDWSRVARRYAEELYAP